MHLAIKQEGKTISPINSVKNLVWEIELWVKTLYQSCIVNAVI
jgi:hypothetical protein